VRPDRSGLIGRCAPERAVPYWLWVVSVWSDLTLPRGEPGAQFPINGYRDLWVLERALDRHTKEVTSSSTAA